MTASPPSKGGIIHRTDTGFYTKLSNAPSNFLMERFSFMQPAEEFLLSFCCVTPFNVLNTTEQRATIRKVFAAFGLSRLRQPSPSPTPLERVG